MTYLHNFNYSDEEIALIRELRSQEFEWSEVRLKMIEAGFRARSVDGLKRGVYRRREDVAARPKPKQPDHHYKETVDSSEARLELRRLKRADAAFCKALERERSQTGLNQTAGTDRPQPVLRP